MATSTRDPRQRERWRFVAILLLAGLFSCSSPRPSAADPDEARAVLQTALDAWQQGSKPAELQQWSPPIHFGDPDCEAGQPLASYKLPDAPEAFGHSLRFRVRLARRNSEGDTITRTVSYLVDTSPARVIIRE